MPSKPEQLEAFAKEMEADTALPLREANFVFGEGNPDCDVLFIGEGPGYHEDVERRPFVGRGGQLLREMIRSIGWKESDVYITNIIKRRPPGNRDPLPEEVEAYAPYLARQIEIINPRIIACLGRFAMNFFLPEAKITRDQGKAFRVGDRLIFPILHPAAALRGTEAMNLFRESFKKLAEVAAEPAVEVIQTVPAVSEKPEKPPQAKLF